MIMPLQDDPLNERLAQKPTSGGSGRYLLALGVVALVVVGAPLYAWKNELLAYRVGSAFGAELDRLARTDLPALESGETDEEGEPIPPPLYLRGRVLVIQMGYTSIEMGGKYGDEIVVPSTVEESLGDLPSGMRATAPGEVDTVVVVRKGFAKFQTKEIGRRPAYDSRGRKIGEWITLQKSYDPEHTYTGRILDLKGGVEVGEFVLTSSSAEETPDLGAFLQTLPKQ